MAVHLAVPDDVFHGVLFCAVLFPWDVLDEVWDWIESVPDTFPTYFGLLIEKNCFNQSPVCWSV